MSTYCYNSHNCSDCSGVKGRDEKAPPVPVIERPERSGSPAEHDPDNTWECDDCGAFIPATKTL